jgi:hypothetical protein
MNFSLPGLATMNSTQRSTVNCAYTGPDDKYWKSQECDTDYDLSNEVVMCSCKHMSYYTIIDNKFDL